jgi:hypothetical protein
MSGGGLKMPGKGGAAMLLSELNAEHAPRPEEEISSNKVTNVTTLQRTNEETVARTKEVSNEPSPEETTEPTKQRRPQRSSEPAPRRTSAASNAAFGEREERLAKALQIAEEDEIAVVTVRVSAKLNKYLDDYVDRINRIEPKRKYRKQDAIAEAFAAFYADHIMPPAPVDEEL